MARAKRHKKKEVTIEISDKREKSGGIKDIVENSVKKELDKNIVYTLLLYKNNRVVKQHGNVDKRNFKSESDALAYAESIKTGMNGMAFNRIVIHSSVNDEVIFQHRVVVK